jgi:DNA-binding NarL/FixJ family response regulator
MALIVTSIGGIVVTLGVVTYLIVRMQRSLEIQQRELSRRLSQLHDLICVTRQELQRLENTLATATIDVKHKSSVDPLEQIEQLADAVSLADSTALRAAAEQIATLPTGIAANLFTADHQNLAISRLLEKGHSLHEISRRLNIPIGEIELLTSMRS